MELNFKKGTINEEKYTKVCKYVLSKNYGDVLDYKVLAGMFEIELSEDKDWHRFSNRMSRVKNIMVDYGIVLKNVIGVGYYILKPKQISSYCYRTYVDKSKELLNKSERILKNVNKKELSDVRKKEHKEMSGLNNKLIEEVKMVEEHSEYVNNKEYYNSLED